MKRLIGLLLGASALLPATASAQERGWQRRQEARGAQDTPERAAEVPAPRVDGAARGRRGGFGGGRADGPRPGFGPGGTRPDGGFTQPGRGDGFARPERLPPQGGFERPSPQGGFDRAGPWPDRGLGFDRSQRAAPQGGYDRPGDGGGNDNWRNQRGTSGGRWIGRDRDGVWRDRNPDWNRGDRWREQARDDNRDRDWNRDRSGWNGGWRDNGNAGDRRGWNRNWRGDTRYDWQHYRLSDRSRYRLPRYYAPYGWGRGYRRFSIGVTIDSVLWGENYWIDDPYFYRLPPVYGPYRWVRYYNDALLVDVRSGYVVDAIYDIFW